VHREHQSTVAGWNHNPCVAHGPIPAPYTYEDTHMMPSHPPVQPPLPPPISVQPSAISDSHNSTPVIHTNPSHTVVDPGNLN